jgi:putative membrane protein
MIFVQKFLVSLIAILHIYFFVLEMFLWSKPLGLKTFKMSQQKADDSSILAANQGLYNGFLAAGLIWSLIYTNPDVAREIALFFLSCVLLAGTYGGYSVHRRIFFIQGLPALAAIVFFAAA